MNENRTNNLTKWVTPYGNRSRRPVIWHVEPIERPTDATVHVTVPLPLRPQNSQSQEKRVVLDDSETTLSWAA